MCPPLEFQRDNQIAATYGGPGGRAVVHYGNCRNAGVRRNPSHKVYNMYVTTYMHVSRELARQKIFFKNSKHLLIDYARYYVIRYVYELIMAR